MDLHWSEVEVPEVLPEDWKEVVHKNGLTFYLHQPTKTVSWTKPYTKTEKEQKVTTFQL